MDSGIYCIRHVSSGRMYVGSSVNIKARWRAHRHRLFQGEHANRHMQNLWNRDGRDSFTFAVLEYCEADDLLRREEAWIEATPPELLLNHCLLPTQTVRGIRWKKSPEGIERSRQFHRGKKWGPLSEDHKAKIRAANLGRKMTPQAIEKWRTSRAGWRPSFEAVEKVRQANLGKKQSSDTIVKRSNALKGRRISDDARARLIAVWTGRKHSDETKAKMRAAKVGRKHSDDTRRKMSESHKRRVSEQRQGKQ